MPFLKWLLRLKWSLRRQDTRRFTAEGRGTQLLRKSLKRELVAKCYSSTFRPRGRGAEGPDARIGHVRTHGNRG